MNKVLRLLRAVSKLSSPSQVKNFVHTSERTNFDSFFNVSWSQAGEDIALLAVFGERTNGLYIDVGAHHPSRFSVTRHLYALGWSGVNVEANPDLIDEFHKLRKRDLNLCLAVGSEEQYTFTIFNEPALSTTNSEWREKFISEANVVHKVIEVKGRKLREILDDFERENPIDLLSIDAEGSDLEVLQSLEFDTLEKARFPLYLLLEAPRL